MKASHGSAPSAAEVAWRAAYREWLATPDGPEEHEARVRHRAALRAVPWEERDGMWERYLAANGSP